MEVEDRVPIHLLYRDLILSGAAFGAHRWLAALQRACERCACLATAGMPPRDIAGGKSVGVAVSAWYEDFRPAAKEFVLQ
jgi:hypothetical protein